ncbi:MAG: peptide deformylase [Dysgonomonas sp.]
MVLISLFACNSTKKMTDKERDLILGGDVDVPLRVLQTDAKEDSLFLRKKSIDIENVENIAKSEKWQHFIERLKLTMAVESGVGIAAVQVGIHRNLFLFMRLDKPGRPVEVVINPRIVNHPEEFFCFKNDGCLSVPDMSGDTKRYAWVEVEYHNEKGELIKERLLGASREGDFTGVIFQHEYDHLQGVLYIDKLYE